MTIWYRTNDLITFQARLSYTRPQTSGIFFTVNICDSKVDRVVSRSQRVYNQILQELMLHDELLQVLN